MDRNGRPNHIEDYLVQLHKGQWFGFQNLNGNDANKTYTNLIIHDSSKTKPTEQACTDGLAQLQLDFDMKELRTKRNKLLSETDYLALSDQTMSSEMTTYRQALRDITNGLTTVEDIEAVTWPTKP